MRHLMSEEAKKNTGSLGLLLTGLLLAGFMIQMMMPDELAIRCLFQRLLSQPCPTCGMTRAGRLLFDAEWRAALVMQPLILIGPVFVVIATGVWRFWKRVAPAMKCCCLIGAAAVLLVLNWIYLIVHRGVGL